MFQRKHIDFIIIHSKIKKERLQIAYFDSNEKNIADHNNQY